MIRFGTETDTDDLTGAPVRTGPVPSEPVIRAALPQLTGDLEQTPPAFSAKHVAGHGGRAYAAARRGQPVELTPVRIRVDGWEMVGIHGDVAELTVDLQHRDVRARPRPGSGSSDRQRGAPGGARAGASRHFCVGAAHTLARDHGAGRAAAVARTPCSRRWLTAAGVGRFRPTCPGRCVTVGTFDGVHSRTPAGPCATRRARRRNRLAEPPGHVRAASPRSRRTRRRHDRCCRSGWRSSKCWPRVASTTARSFHSRPRCPVRPRGVH